MHETNKLNNYRLSKNYNQYFKGNGIDIGCGSDMLKKQIFTSINNIQPYDLNDGDAQLCSNLIDNSFDFVYSSHCLEHMRDANEALNNWIRICKTQGHIIFAIPHEIYYEKGIWPSRYNNDHKWSFRMEQRTILPKSINIYDFLSSFKDKIDIVSVELLLHNFDFTKFYEDQTLGNSVCQIEIILQKK